MKTEKKTIMLYVLMLLAVFFLLLGGVALAQKIDICEENYGTTM